MPPVSVTAARAVAPLAVAAAPADPLAVINTAVTNWFDGAAKWLSGLPANPITELLQGGLLLVRRTFFNQTPTAKADQYLTLATGEIIGSVGAVDPEGDVLRYSLAEVPKFGTAQIAPDGTYTYTPGQGYAGSDSFQVAVTDSGRNLLSVGRAPTVATVRVGYTEPGQYSRGFDAKNLTGQPLQLVSLNYNPTGGFNYELESGPPIGTIIFPGDSAHFEVTYESGYNTYGLPEFLAVKQVNGQWLPDGTDRRWRAILRVSLGDPSVTCGAGGGTCVDDYSTALFYDPVNTVRQVTDPEEQAVILRHACNGSDFQCNFVVSSSDVNGYTKPKYVTATEANATSSEQTRTVTRADTTTKSVSWSAGGSVSGGVEKAFYIGVEAHGDYSESEAKTQTYSDTVTIPVKPFTQVFVFVEYPAIKAKGDMTVHIGNTTFTLPNAEFIVRDPNPNRPGPNWITREAKVDSLGKPVEPVPDWYPFPKS